MKKFLLQMWRMLSVGLESFDLNQRRREQHIDAVKKIWTHGGESGKG